LSSERRKDANKKEELLKLLGNQESNIKLISDNIYKRMKRPKSNNSRKIR
jgi:hypothetical protein